MQGQPLGDSAVCQNSDRRNSPDCMLNTSGMMPYWRGIAQLHCNKLGDARLSSRARSTAVGPTLCSAAQLHAREPKP